MALMPGIVWLLARDFQQVPGKFDFAVLLSRVTFPYLALVSLVVVASAIPAFRASRVDPVDALRSE